MNARLRIVHAIPLLQPYSEYLADSRFEEDLRQDARRRIADLLREAGSHAPLCVAMGEPRDVVAEEARRHAMDLVVIGRGCLKEKLGRLRTQSYGIIREAPCPVISM
jgi:nucleotide-binding universal stress UspA family protein